MFSKLLSCFGFGRRGASAPDIEMETLSPRVRRLRAATTSSAAAAAAAPVLPPASPVPVLTIPSVEFFNVSAWQPTPILPSMELPCAWKDEHDAALVSLDQEEEDPQEIARLIKGRYPELADAALSASVLRRRLKWLEQRH